MRVKAEPNCEVELFKVLRYCAVNEKLNTKFIKPSMWLFFMHKNKGGGIIEIMKAWGE